MSDPKPGKKRIEIDDLSISKETLQNLTDTEADQVGGGQAPADGKNSGTCATACGQGGTACGCQVTFWIFNCGARG